MWFRTGGTRGKDHVEARSRAADVTTADVFRAIDDVNTWSDPFGRNNEMSHQVRFFDAEQRPLDTIAARQALLAGRQVDVYRLELEKTGEYKQRSTQVGWHITTQSRWADHGTTLRSTAELATWWTQVGEPWTRSGRALR